MSTKKANALALVLFFIGLAWASFYGTWWPSILLIIAIPLSIRHLLLKNFYDLIIIIAVFGSIYVLERFGVTSNILIPILFLLIALYVFLRNFLGLKPAKKNK